jgi:hypothetical protein
VRGRESYQKFPSKLYFSKKIININKNIIDEWLGFFGTHGLPLFSDGPQKKKKKKKWGPSNIVHNGPCRISTRFFIEGHLLGPKPQMTLV